MARRLLLSPACRLLRQDGTLTVSTREQELVLESEHAGVLESVFNALHGGAVPEALLDEYGMAGSALAPVFEALLEDDLLLELDADGGRVAAAVAAAALRREARFWARPIFEQAFWQELLAGASSRAQVLGWGLEFYHFVEAANSYMPLGLAHTRHARGMRGPIAQHYVEEMHHGAIFLEGLIGCGIERASILAAPPLPHTKALVHQLVELAYEGELTYAASLAVMQPGLSVDVRQDLKVFYGRLTSLYPYAAPMLQAFQYHAGLDVDLQHEEGLLSRLCECKAGLSGEEYALAGAAMRTVAESFTLFFEGIRDSYAGDMFAPRRPLYLEGVL